MNAAQHAGILRPQYESELTIQDRTASLFAVDLIQSYQSVFPSLVEKKKAETGRVMPVRKRTTLVDQRISRSRLSSDADRRELLEHQLTMQKPPRPSSPNTQPTSTSQSAPGPVAAPSRGMSATLLDLGIPTFKEPEDDDDDGDHRNIRSSRRLHRRRWAVTVASRRFQGHITIQSMSLRRSTDTQKSSNRFSIRIKSETNPQWSSRSKTPIENPLSGGISPTNRPRDLVTKKRKKKHHRPHLYRKQLSLFRAEMRKYRSRVGLLS